MPSAQTAGALNALHTLRHRASPNGANATAAAAAAAAAAVTSDGSSTVTSTPAGARVTRVATPGSAAADLRLDAFARSAGAAASGQGQLGLFEGYTSDIGMEGSQVGSAS